ncbi:hypothetical protein [Halorussus sp. AFM4]|uniref:hypothetical protein n=1 Tax=Halorussus sp. AFM4 TaxID=3421651 RepID=UPI003EBE778D
MAEIRFETDPDAVQKSAPGEIFSGFDILVDGESVFEQLKLGTYVNGFSYEFFLTTVGALEALHDGHPHKFEVEHPFVLKFDPHGSELELFLRAPAVIDREDEQHYYVDFQEFARAVIETTDEFLEFVVEVRPELANHHEIERLRESLESRREWYRETYGEDV